MAKLPKPVDTLTPFPSAPLSLPTPRLTDTEYDALGTTLKQVIDIQLGNRALYDESLDIWDAMYDLRTIRLNQPWEGSSNLALPTLTAACDELTSRVCGSVFQERLWTMAGTDAISSQFAHTCEQFFNGEFDENNWYDPLEACIGLAAKHGVSYCEIWWELSTRQELRYQEESITGLTGEAQRTRVPKLVTLTDYDAPRFHAVESRDLVVFPNHAPNLRRDADGYARKIYMSESDIRSMVENKLFRQEAVDYVIESARPRTGEATMDPQGTRSYSIGGLINVVDASVAPAEDIPMSSGPFLIWRALTRQFDLNRDGKYEWNVVWVHDRTRKVLGVAPYEYWGGLPIFPLSLFPRWNRIYGYGIMQRGRSVIEEKNSTHNARLDYMDLASQPMPYKTRGAKIPDENRRWGFDNVVEVTKADDVGFIAPPPFPEASVVEEQILDQELNRIAGAPTAPASQAPVGGAQQRSARAAQMDAEIRSAQSNTVNRRVRAWLLDIFKFTVSLYRQYGPNQMETTAQGTQGAQKVIVPKEILGLNYRLGVVGMGGPLDKATRRQDFLMLAQFLFQTPLVQGNLERVWTICRMVVETFDIPEVTALIGSLDDAKQQAQAQAQAAQLQQKKEMLMAILQHGAFKPGQKKPGGSAPASGATNDAASGGAGVAGGGLSLVA